MSLKYCPLWTSFQQAPQPKSKNCFFFSILFFLRRSRQTPKRNSNSKILPLEVVLIIETAGNASRPSSAVSLAIESVSRQTVLPSPAARSPIGLVLSVTALTGRRAAPLDPSLRLARRRRSHIEWIITERDAAQ